MRLLALMLTIPLLCCNTNHLFGTAGVLDSSLPHSMQKKIEPYIISDTHPIKTSLDTFFAKYPNALDSEDALRDAGFVILYSQRRTEIEIVEHPLFPGYIFKLFLPGEKTKKNKPGWEILVTRCYVAKKITALINQHHLSSFIVADKWLYPTPQPSAQPVLLVAKKLNILSREETLVAWQHASKPLLRQLFTILKHGYGSCLIDKNIPITTDGNFAFIDTENLKKNPRLTHVHPFLSKSGKKYWDQLIQKDTQHNFFNPKTKR